MKSLKVILIFLAMTLEVRIRASSPTVESELGVKNVSSQVVHKRTGSAEVIIGPQSVYSQDGSKIKWVFGTGVVQSSKSINITSIFGQIYCEKSCVVALKKDDEKLSIHAFSGTWSVTGLGSQEEVRLDPGSSIDLNSVSREMHSQLQFPYTLSEDDFKGFLVVYLGLNPQDASWKKMNENWAIQVELISNLYQDRAYRSIASHKDQVERQARARRLEQLETERIRKEFRQRNGLD